MRVIVGFKNNKTKKVWMKSFLSIPSARRAVAGITKKTSNSVLDVSGKFSKRTKNTAFETAKGFKYGRELRYLNRKRKY